MTEKNRVVKSDSNQFWVERNGEIIKCKARSKLKKDAIVVGDFVLFDEPVTEPIIDGIIPRKNKLVRPLIANVDQIIIMVAAVPEIDYLLIDKLIINAAKQNIDALICVNKSDIGLASLKKVREEYGKAVTKIISCCAISGEIDEVIQELSGKLTCFAGQSAVGKSTIVNAILGNLSQKTGELSRKISRGKNTTTASEIFPAFGGFVVDTPGFSTVDIFDILPQELSHFYPEFDDYRGECKFSTCTHTNEPQCEVAAAASRGDISQFRLERYRRLYLEAKDFLERNPKQKTRSE